MKIALHGEGIISHLDPGLSLSSAERQVLPQIFEMLVKQTIDGQIEPELAESYEVQKNKLVFTLNHRVFHNRKVVNLEDVKASLIKAFNNPNRTSCNEWRGGQIYLSNTEIKINDGKLILPLDKYTAIQILEELSQISFAIRPKNQLPSKTIGSGPYKLQSLSKDSVKLTAFEEHPYFKRSFKDIHFIGFPTKEMRHEAFLSGDLDEYTHWGRVENIKDFKKLEPTASSSYFLNLLQFHQNSNVFLDESLKSHFYQAVQTCINDFPGGHPWVPATGLVPPSFYGHRKSSSNNQSKIKPLKAPRKIHIAVSHQRQADEILSIFSNGKMSSYGWSIEPVILNSHTLKKENSFSKNIDATAVSLHFSNKYSLDIVKIFSKDHPINFSHHNVFQIDKMIEQMETATTDESIFLFHEIENLLAENKVCIPVGYIPIYKIQSKSVRAELIDSNSIYSFRYLKATTGELKSNLRVQSKYILQLESQISELKAESKLIQSIEQIAHDIKSPIGALDTLLGFLQKLPPDQLLLYKNSLTRIKALADKVSYSSFKKTNLSDYKSFVSKESFHDTESQPVNIGPIIKEILQESSLQYENPIFFNNECLQNDTILANEIELKRILSNMIKNSVHSYLGDSSGNIYLQLLKHDDYLSITIQDSGHGIEKENFENVFEKRFTTKQNSSGLGLYHAKKYLENWGGKIHLASIKNEGTTITLKLKKTTEKTQTA